MMKRKGSIELITGPMFSGKTEELMRRVRRAYIAKQDVMIFKPSLDDRYSKNEIVTHDGKKMHSLTIDSSDHGDVLYNSWVKENKKRPEIIAVEEVQFFDQKVINKILNLRDLGTRVIITGLDMDWRGQPFHITSYLLSLATRVDKLTAVCTICGDEATHSYLKNKTGEQIQVGATEKYEARCYNDWKL